MKIRHVLRHGEEEVELQMTPMIDIVFQLLIFFIMTFKIIAPEGDFNIKMPLEPAEGLPDEDQLPPIKVRLRATENGELASIRMGQRTLGTFGELHNEIRQIVGDDRGPGSLAETEVEFDCDYNLHFEYVIRAVTAVSGYIQDGQIIKVVEKIKFSRPRPE